MTSLNLTLEVLLDDVEGCMAFYDFIERYHAAENLQFWMSVEAFKNRDWKAAKILGIDKGKSDDIKDAAAKVAEAKAAEEKGKQEAEDKKQNRLSRRLSKRRMSKKNVKGAATSGGSFQSQTGSDEEDPLEIEMEKARKREKEEAKAAKHQKKLDTMAAQRIGISLQQLYLIKEADYIFDTFIRPGAPNWVCIDHSEVARIEEKLADFKRLKRDVFKRAQEGVYNGMAEDLLPRFLKEVDAAGSGSGSSSGSGNVNGKKKAPGGSSKGKVPPPTKEAKDLRDHLEKLGQRRRRKTGVTTALAFGFGRRFSATNANTDESKNTGSSGKKGSSDESGRMKSLKVKRSQLVFLQREDSIGALPLSRSLLSMRQPSSLAMTPTQEEDEQAATEKKSAHTHTTSSPSPGRKSNGARPISRTAQGTTGATAAALQRERSGDSAAEDQVRKSRLRLSQRSVGSTGSAGRGTPPRRSSMKVKTALLGQVQQTGGKPRSQSDTMVSSDFLDREDPLPPIESGPRRYMSIGGYDFDSSGLTFRPVPKFNLDD